MGAMDDETPGLCKDCGKWTCEHIDARLSVVLTERDAACDERDAALAALKTARAERDAVCDESDEARVELEEWKRRAEAAERVVDAARRIPLIRCSRHSTAALEMALNHYDLACSNAECATYEAASKNAEEAPESDGIPEPDVATTVKREVARALREVASNGARSYPSPTWEVAFVHVASRLEQVK